MKENRNLTKCIGTCLIAISIISMSVTSPVLSKTEESDDDVRSVSTIVAEEDWMKTDIGEYPIDVESGEWKNLSPAEAAAACDMPKKIAEGLTTEELVDYAVNYPFLMDVLAYDELKDGMSHLENKSGVFKELFSRIDVVEKLIDEYRELEVDYEKVAQGKASATDYDAQMFIEEYIGLKYGDISNNEASEFVVIYGEKCEEMNDYLKDSTLTMVFYEGVEESMGEIPEKSIPESLEEDIMYSTDIGGASFEKNSSGYCGICGQLQDYGNINVHQKAVYVYKWISGGYSSSDIANLDGYIAEHYPSFVRLRSATGKYNCHSYAWYSTSSDNIYCINEPSPIYNNTSYWTLWNSSMREIKAGDRVTFWDADGNLQHSGIINTENGCTSKLGHYGVYQTTLSAMRGFYRANTPKYYIPK